MKPATIRSVMRDMPFLRTPDPEVNYARAVQLVGEYATARDAAQRYRAALTRHPDLAAKVCALFGYTDITHWNGYVPPRLMTPPDNNPRTGDIYNNSPYRAKLAALVTEALTRDSDHQHYDERRLAPVPAKALRAAWSEAPGSKKDEGLWPE